MNRRERIDKIRILARRGATEGERAAARAALERLGEPLETPQPLRPNQEWTPFFTPPPRPHFEYAAPFLSMFEDMKNDIYKMMTEFGEKYAAMRKAGLSETEIETMVSNGTFWTWEENQ